MARGRFLQFRFPFVVTFLAIILYVFPLLSPRAALAAACPFVDGGPEDSDGNGSNGVIVFDSDQQMAADPFNLGVFDCSSLDFQITNNSTLRLLSHDSGGDRDYTNDFSVNVSFHSLTIDAGSRVTSDFSGYPGGCGADAGYGPGGGAGDDTGGSGSGAGFGGVGGNSDTKTGGTTYGSAYSPVEMGSGGGGTTGICGGQGGGGIKITATTTITNNGWIDADGVPADSIVGTRSAGAGSGGSIYLIAHDVAGSGTVTANAGDVLGGGNSDGGGGGGGRILVEAYSNSLTIPAPHGSTGNFGTGANGTYAFNHLPYVVTPLTKMGQYRADGVKSIAIGGTNNTGTTYLPVTVDTEDSTGPKITDSQKQAGSGTSLGVSITATGSSRLLVLNVSYLDGTSVDSVTFDGQSFTKGTCTASGDLWRNEMWYLVNPNLTTADITANFSSNASDISLHAVNVVNVNQSTPISAQACDGTGVWSKHASVSLSAQTNELFFAGVNSYVDAQTFTADAYSTDLALDGTGMLRTQTAFRAGTGGSTTLAMEGTSAWPWAMSGLAISPAVPYSPLALKLQYEVLPIASAFTDSANYSADISFEGIPHRYTATTITGLAAGDYHWQSRVCDNTLLTCSAWTSFGGNPESDADFTIIGNTTPDVPTSLGPTQYVDGSSGSTVQPTLTFSQSDTDTSDSVKYQIEIDTHSDFSSPVVRYTSVLGDQGSASFTVGQGAGNGTYAIGSASQVLYNGSYYWRVKTIDQNTAASTFTTANSGAVAFVITGSIDPASPPDAPTSLGPTAYVDGSSGTNPNPALEFTLSDPNVLDTVKYRIQIAKNSTFSSPVVDYTSDLVAQGPTSFTVGQAAGSGSYTTGSEGQLIYDGSYYWRVQTIDNGAHTSSYTSANSGAVAFVITGNIDPYGPNTPTVMSQYKLNALRQLSVGDESTDTSEKLKVNLSQGTLTGPHQTSSVQNFSDHISSLTTDPITPSGSNRVLVATIGFGSSSGITSVSFGGQAMTEVCTSSAVGFRSSIWYLVNPDTTAGTVDVQFPEVTDGVGVAVMNYENVNQATPIRDSSCASSAAYNRTPNTSVTTVIGDKVIGVMSTYTGDINRISSYQPFDDIVDDSGTTNVRMNAAEKTAITTSTEVKWWGERRWPWGVAAVALEPASTVSPLDLVARVEVQPVGSNFTNYPTATGSAVPFVGTEISALVTTNTLAVDTNYHWQSQVCTSDFAYCSIWASFGANDEGNMDFRVVTNTAPNTPTIPGDEHLIDGNFTNNLTPTFNFTLTDPEANEQLGYHIILSTHADFSSPILDYTSDYRDQLNDIGFAQRTYFTLGQDLENGTYTVGAEGQDPLLTDTTYYWRVKTIDSHGLESSYLNESFTTDTTPPVVSGLSISVTDTSATLTWDTTKPTNSFAFIGPRTEEGFYSESDDDVVRVLHHSYTINSLLPCVSYFVQASASDAASNLGLSSTAYFTTTGCTGGATVSSLVTQTVPATTGGTLALLSGGTGATLDVPVAAYATTSADLQIKKLDKTAVFTATSNPSGYLPVGDFVYDFHAVQSVFTAITSFNAPVTVTLAYDGADQSAITAGTLKMYRWDGAGWNALSNCVDNSGTKTISCTTTGFSTFSLFGVDPNAPVATPTPSPSPTVEPSPTAWSGLGVSCGAVTPYPPSIFQLDSRSTAVTLYVTPSTNLVQNYTVSYGKTASADTFTLELQSDGEGGVIAIDVAGLDARAQYYFKILAKNGCSASPWSATRARFNSAQIEPGGGIIPLPPSDEVGPPSTPTPSSSPGIGDGTGAGGTGTIIPAVLRGASKIVTVSNAAEAATILGAIAAIETTAVAPLVTAASGGRLSLKLLEQIFRAFGILPPLKIQGIAYDTASYKMVPFVLLTFEGKIPGSSEVLHETAVTDQFGRYGGVKLLPGQYTAVASHQEYAFPTKRVRPFYFAIQDFYKGEVFTQKPQDEKQFLTVPLDPLGMSERRSLKQQLFFLLSLISKVSNTLIVPLFALSLFLAIRTPSFFNIVFVLIYATMCLSKIPKLLRKPTLSGVTQTSAGRPVPHAIVKLFDPTTNEVSDVIMSDDQGKYKFFAKQGTYTYQVIKEGFQSMDTDTLSLSQLDTKKIQEKNFILEPYTYAS